MGYPVDNHFDNHFDNYFDKLADGEQSLENKMTFQIDLKVGNSNIGGCDKTKFVFALLDWTKSGTNSTRCKQYIAAGGNLPKGVKLTQSMWTKQFGI